MHFVASSTKQHCLPSAKVPDQYNAGADRLGNHVMEVDLLPHEPDDDFIQSETYDPNCSDNKLHRDVLYGSPVEHPEPAQTVIREQAEQKGNRGCDQVVQPKEFRKQIQQAEVDHEGQTSHSSIARKLLEKIVQRVFRTFILESVAFDPVLRLLPPALRG